MTAEAGIKALMQWFEARGGHAGPVDVGCVDGLRGLVATQPVAPGELLLGVPRTAMFSTHEARATQLGRKLDGVEGLNDQAVLAVGLVSLRRHGGVWQPMLDVMPRAFRERPDGYERRDWDLLRGSHTARRAREGWKQMLEQHRRVDNALRRTSPVAVSAFAWGYLAACTRAIPLHAGPNLTAIAAVADMLNHANDCNCEFSGDPAHLLELRAVRPVAAGEALTCSYGDLPNTSLLARYGFCLADNVHDRAAFELPLPSGHWLEGLASASGKSVGEHAMGRDPLSHHGARLFHFLRLRVISEARWHGLRMLGGPVGDDVPVLRPPEERKVLEDLAAECETRLAAFADPVETDDALLDSGGLTPPQRDAVTVRRGEKRILQHTLAHARRGAQALELEGAARVQALQSLTHEPDWGGYFSRVLGRLGAC